MEVFFVDNEIAVFYCAERLNVITEIITIISNVKMFSRKFVNKIQILVLWPNGIARKNLVFLGLYCTIVFG
jgi:hypothetical protein